jgi:hypothetical protein
VFHRFQGGKGVATAAGVLLALSPWLGLATLATWIVIAVFFRYSSFASLVSAVFAPAYYMLLAGGDLEAERLAAVGRPVLGRVVGIAGRAVARQPQFLAAAPQPDVVVAHEQVAGAPDRRRFVDGPRHRAFARGCVDDRAAIGAIAGCAGGSEMGIDGGHGQRTRFVPGRARTRPRVTEDGLTPRQYP